MHDRGAVTAVCPGCIYTVPPLFLQRLWPVCTVYLSKSDTICTSSSTYGTSSICGSWLNSKQAFSSFPEHSISYILSLSILLAPFHVENTPVRLSPSIRKETVCWILMKVGTRVIYKKLLGMHDFRKNLSTDTHCLFNTLRTGSFKLFKRPFPGFLTILTL